MARIDKYGDKGPKRDRRSLGHGAAGIRARIGSYNRIHRSDGTEVTYLMTVAGYRMVPGSDTGVATK